MRLLHAGCGRTLLPPIFASRYEEVRLDIDHEVAPDIVASLTNLGDIGTFDAVYTSHCLEHLCPQDVRVALAEFYRVTAKDGFVAIIVPDLEDVTATDEILKHAPTGDTYVPLSGLDLIYGCRFDRGNEYMAHHCGFTSTTLEGALRAAGFARVDMKRLAGYNLMGIARPEAA